MYLRIAVALALCLGMASGAAAQVVRFETTVGEFDMVLNPTNNPVLQGHVDNLLAYVENGNYNGSWINRAVEGFVLQMGGFFAHTKRPPLTADSTRPVATFEPIEGEPAAENPGLSNTVGTVSMALPSVNDVTIQDGGTSSFFINLADNSGLDANFTVFAAIPDMTVVDAIMGLTQIDRTNEASFGPVGNAAFSDVPLDENGFQVFIERAYALNDAMSIDMAIAGVQSVMAESIAGGGGGSSAAGTTSLAVPEPAGIIAAALALFCFALRPIRVRQLW